MKSLEVMVGVGHLLEGDPLAKHADWIQQRGGVVGDHWRETLYEFAKQKPKRVKLCGATTSYCVPRMAKALLRDGAKVSINLGRCRFGEGDTRRKGSRQKRGDELRTALRDFVDHPNLRIVG